jgi:hypothetical protein
VDEAGVNAAEDGRTDPVLARFLVNSKVQQLNVEDPRGPNALAEAAGVSAATWKRWTSGKNIEWRQPQIIAAMSALGYDYKHQTTQDLVRLAADARKNNVVRRPEWLRSTAFDLLVAIERVSERVRNFELTLVPGLLQTPAYARATHIAAGYTDEQELAERVQLRIDRQAVLRRQTDPVEYSALIDEAVLHRAPAGDGVMRGQLEHLLKLGLLPNVTIQVVPYSIGPYLTDGNGPFVILESRRVGRQITYVETSVAATYIETPEANQRYADAWQRLAERALGPKETAEMIRGLLTSSTPR